MLLQLQNYFSSRGAVTSVVAGADSPDPQFSDYSVFQPAPGAGWRERLGEYRAMVESTRPDVVYQVSGVEEADLMRFLPYPRVRHVFTLEEHEFINVPHWLRKLGNCSECCTANTPDVLDAIRKWARYDFAGVLVPYRLAAEFYNQYTKPAAPVRRPAEICCIGRLENYQKRVDWIPEVIEGCRAAGRNFIWHIYGAGPAEEALRKELRVKGCLDLVNFHGWLGSDDLAVRAREHDVYFSCSRFEGLPVAMLEAMFCGLICVVPLLPGGIEHVVKQGGAFGYKGKTPADAIHGLIRATQNLEDLPRRKQQTRSVAEKLFGLEVVEKQYRELEQVLSNLKYNGRALDVTRAPKVRLVGVSDYLKRRLFFRKGHDPLASSCPGKLRRLIYRCMDALAGDAGRA